MSEHTFKSSPDKGTPRTVQYKKYTLEIAIRDQKIEQTEQELKEAREEIEEIVKEELTKNPGPPGKFYPFMSGKIKVDSPLGQLLATKGITPENSNQFEGSANW